MARDRCRLSLRFLRPGLTGHAYVDTGIWVSTLSSGHVKGKAEQEPKPGQIRRTRIAAAFIIHPARKGPGACVRGSIVGKRPRDRNVGFTLTIRFFASVQEHRPVHTRRRRHRHRRRRRRRFSSSSPRDRTAHSELIRGIINAGD